MKDSAIELEPNPIEKDYEDYICAFFQSGGLYVERSIIHRETEEILELDIITTDFESLGVERNLIEIKSSSWGFSEIFKVKGWLVYLKMDTGVFIVKKSRDSFEYFKNKSAELGIELIENCDLKKTEDCLAHLLRQKIDAPEIETLRYAYLIERNLLKSIKDLKKKFPNNQSYINADDYFFKINSGSFFSNNPVRRIRQVFETYIKYKNLTAKMCYELGSGKYNDKATYLSNNCYKSVFYNAEDSELHIALYIEHLARLTILKTCTEQLLRKHCAEFNDETFEESLEYLNLPQTIQRGLVKLVKEPYFHRYPVFWQFFTYVMGGFILLDHKEKEFEYISKNTEIPVEEIPRAFESFNVLFPKLDGWMAKIPNSNIEMHRFFPLPFCGLGANHRRSLHLSHLPEDEQTYEELSKILTGDKTYNDLIKWNNLGYRILK